MEVRFLPFSHRKIEKMVIKARKRYYTYYTQYTHQIINYCSISICLCSIRVLNSHIYISMHTRICGTSAILYIALLIKFGLHVFKQRMHTIQYICVLKIQYFYSSKKKKQEMS